MRLLRYLRQVFAGVPVRLVWLLAAHAPVADVEECDTLACCHA